MDTPGSSNPSILNPVAESSTRNQRQPQQPNHRRKPRPNPTEGPAGVSDRPASDTSKPPPRRRPPRRDNKPQDGGNGSENSKANERGAGNGRRPPKPRPQNTDKQEKAEPSVSRPPGQGRRKGIKFGGQLTSSNEANSEASDTHQSTSKPRRERYRRDPDPQEDDLTSNLIRSLRNPPYADCPICFNSIHPPQPTWSCSPLTPIVAEEKAGETSHEDHEPQYCWTTFHLKCIKSWSEKSYNDVKAAWAARGEEGRGGEWRCPGCQGRRNTLTRGYWCFCGSTSHPNNRLATPHSCGNPCSRPRTSCSHPCSLLCHPGPCPPCKVSLEIVCGCIRKRVLVVKCGDNKDQHGRTKGAVVSSSSCGATCSKTLNCGKHQCQRVCHLGDCAPCEEREVLRCWCGQHDREGRCGEGDIWEGERAGCSDENLSISKILRGFNCGNSCGKLYDCGTHHCEKPCHPSSDDDPRHCPLSPDRVHTCPCGKKAIASSTESDGAFPPRQKCTDPVPTCGSPCHKLHTRDGILQCDHPCQSPCHSGPCPPCSVEILRPCRCGSTTKKVMCGDLWPSKGPEGKEGEVLCDKPCMGLRACGRHQCNRLCCPMASFAAPTKGKGKKKTGMNEDVLDEALKALHECDLVCGKTLTCGNHHCEERDHKGPCKPCLRSSFEELICACGRTVLEPPVACGTKVQCPFPCSKPPPPCGHQKAPHACHSEDVACPPCPFLTSKICACGKKEIGNVKCSLVREKVSCGTQCGKLMGCGFHRCDRLCHAGDCGDCTSMCGKARKLCLPEQHPCTSLCHAPAVCPEDEPCQSSVYVSCSCGRIRQAVQCGKSTSRPNGTNRLQPKCTSECGIAQRNARLADALGIKTDGRSNPGSEATYNEDLVGFARTNMKFLGLVESAFAEFVTSPKKTQVLPHMPPDRRKFVHDLAHVYRLDTQMVDQEPHRSVQIIRRVDTRIPHPLLSAHIASLTASAPTLGKLGNLRGGTVASPSWRKPSTGATSSHPSIAAPTATTPSSSTRGWTSVVARSTPPPNVRPTPPPASGNPSRTGTPDRTSRTTTSSSNVVPVAPSVPPSEPVDVPDDWEDDA